MTSLWKPTGCPFKHPRPAHCKNTQNTRDGFRHSHIMQQCFGNFAALCSRDAPLLRRVLIQEHQLSQLDGCMGGWVGVRRTAASTTQAQVPPSGNPPPRQAATRKPTPTPQKEEHPQNFKAEHPSGRSLQGGLGAGGNFLYHRPQS